jgi:hypothetical protein
LTGGVVSAGAGLAAAPGAVVAGARGIGHAISDGASAVSHGADRLFDWLVDD